MAVNRRLLPRGTDLDRQHAPRPMAADSKCALPGDFHEWRWLPAVLVDGAVGDRLALAVPAGRSALAHERVVCSRLQRDKEHGKPDQHDTDARPDRRRVVLANRYRVIPLESRR